MVQFPPIFYCCKVLKTTTLQSNQKIFVINEKFLNVKKTAAVIFATAKVATITAMVFFTFNSPSRSSNIWYSCIHHFK